MSQVLGEIADTLDPGHCMETFVTLLLGYPVLGILLQGPDRRDQAIFLDVWGYRMLRGLLEAAEPLMEIHGATVPVTVPLRP